MRSQRIAALLGVALTACAPGAPKSDADSTVGGTPTNVVAEARAFMDAYARDLIAGNRSAIVSRYDRTGVYFVGNGRKDFVPYDSVVKQYDQQNGWSPPAVFEWRDLSFEPAGPDGVVVAGRFLWGSGAGAPPMTLSYTGFLRRQDRVLRIRLEDESVDPSSLPTARPPGDSVRH